MHKAGLFLCTAPEMVKADTHSVNTNQRLLVLVDYSGSMAEMGRPCLVRRLCQQIQEFVTMYQLPYKPEVWYITADGMSTNSAEVAASGKLDWYELSAWMQNQLTPETRLLIIGDGNCYTRIHVNRIEAMLSDRGVRRAAVHAGIGSDTSLLNSLVGASGKTFHPEEIWEAMSFLICSTHSMGAAGEAENDADEYD